MSRQRNRYKSTATSKGGQENNEFKKLREKRLSKSEKFTGEFKSNLDYDESESDSDGMRAFDEDQAEGNIRRQNLTIAQKMFEQELDNPHNNSVSSNTNFSRSSNTEVEQSKSE